MLSLSLSPSPSDTGTHEPTHPFRIKHQVEQARGNGTIVPCLCLISQKAAPESAFSTLPLPENEIRTCP